MRALHTGIDYWLLLVAATHHLIHTQAEATIELGSLRSQRDIVFVVCTVLSVNCLTSSMQVSVPGDNNCQFHALVDQLKKLKNHKTDAFTLRNDCVDWLHANGDIFMEVTLALLARMLLTVPCLLQLDHPKGRP